MISYAQNLEDVILNRLFKGKTDGFYIDVGAFDPDIHSVTRYFYDMGWNGINIEPIDECFQKFQKKRLRDINLNVAIGLKKDNLEIYTFPNAHEYASMKKEVAVYAAKYLDQKIRTHTIPVVSLAAICEQHVDGPIDFIKIDVEGYEKETLLGGNWKKFRPTMIVIEAMKPCLAVVENWDAPDQHAAWPEWEPIILDAGYLQVYFDGMNKYYLRQEDKHLQNRFIIPISPIQDGFTFPAFKGNEELRTAVQTEKERNLHLDQQIGDISQKINGQKESIVSLKAVIDSLAKKLEQKVFVAFDTERELAALSRNKVQLQNEIGVYKDLADEARKEIVELRRSQESLRRNNKDIIQKTEIELADQKRQKEQLENEIVELRRSQESLRRNNKDIIQKAEIELADQKRQKEQLENEINLLKNITANLKKKDGESQAEVDRLVEEKNELLSTVARFEDLSERYKQIQLDLEIARLNLAEIKGELFEPQTQSDTALDKSDGWPRISIVTAVLNSRDDIELTLQSIARQTYPAIEYIVIDGGSTDGTLEIIERYSDCIDQVSSEPDEGIYDAMNKGIRLASGEWILFLNAGDQLWGSDVFKRIFSESVDGIDCIYGDTFLKKPDGKLILEKALDLDGNMWKFNPFYHQSMIVRTKLMEQKNFNTNYKIVADSDFIYDQFLNGKKFLRLDFPISIYLAGGLSMRNEDSLWEERKKMALSYGEKSQVEIDAFYDDIIARCKDRSDPYSYMNG